MEEPVLGTEISGMPEETKKMEMEEITLGGFSGVVAEALQKYKETGRKPKILLVFSSEEEETEVNNVLESTIADLEEREAVASMFNVARLVGFPFERQLQRQSIAFAMRDFPDGKFNVHALLTRAQESFFTTVASLTESGEWEQKVAEYEEHDAAYRTKESDSL